MGCQCHFPAMTFFLNFSVCFIISLPLININLYRTVSYDFTVGCFIIVSQGLSQGVHLVTGCLAMVMLHRPVRKTAKSFRWNRQVQKITLSIPHDAFITEMVYSTCFVKLLHCIFSSGKHIAR